MHANSYTHVQFLKCLVSFSYVKKLLQMKPLDNIAPFLDNAAICYYHVTLGQVTLRYHAASNACYICKI
jgi:hypothetical protein